MAAQPVLAARLLVHVQPRAKRTEVAGRHGDALKIRLAAPPEDGAANDELVRFVAERLGLPRRSVSLASGHTSRRKLLVIEGASGDVAAQLERATA